MIENVFNLICFLWSTSRILEKNVLQPRLRRSTCVLIVMSGDVHVVGQKYIQRSKTHLTGYVFFDPLHQFSLQCRTLPIFCLSGRFDRFDVFVMTLSCFRLFRFDTRFNKRFILTLPLLALSFAMALIFCSTEYLFRLACAYICNFKLPVPKQLMRWVSTGTEIVSARHWKQKHELSACANSTYSGNFTAHGISASRL